MSMATSTFYAAGDIPKGALVAYTGTGIVAADSEEVTIHVAQNACLNITGNGDTWEFDSTSDPGYVWPPVPTTVPGTLPWTTVPATIPSEHWQQDTAPPNITIIPGTISPGFEFDLDLNLIEEVVSDHWIGYMRYVFTADQRVCIDAVPVCECGCTEWELASGTRVVIVEKTGYVNYMFVQEEAIIGLPKLACDECDEEYYHLYVMG